MEMGALPVPRMDWAATDAAQALKKFKQRCELYFSGPLKSKDEKEQIAYLLIWAGEEARDLVSTWTLTEDESGKLVTYWGKFETFVQPKSNFRLARYKLRTLKQEQGESVDQFLRKIRTLVNECKYTKPDEHIIDALIFGSSNSRVQSKLLEFDEKLTLDKAIDTARTQEATASQLNDMQDTKVHAMKHGRGARPKQTANTNSTHKASTNEKTCGNCGTIHKANPRSLCPAYGTTCNACQRSNHWKVVCRSENPGVTKTENYSKSGKQSRKHTKRKQGVHTLDNTQQEMPVSRDDSSQLYFHSIHVDTTSASRSDTQALLKVLFDSGEHSAEIMCKIDTGAEGNVIPIDTYRKLCLKSSHNASSRPPGLTSSDVSIIAFGGHKIQHYGTCNLKLTHRGQTSAYLFHVVNTNGPTILGLPTCRDMGLVTLNYSVTTDVEKVNVNYPGDPTAKAKILSEYKDCFEGVGCFKGEFHITLDRDVPPVIHPPRRVPEALREPLKAELDSYESQGIIAKVDVPTDWVNSLVCVTKSNGTLRLCLDPKNLNAAIKRPHHCTPTIDEVLPKLNGAKYFSIVDARSGYWNIKLDHESSLYTTFNTPHGRYCFLRLPFGVICAQDVFQKKVDETFGDLPGVTGIIDDIVVFGHSKSDHDKNLRAVMERARETGLRFNADKCKIQCSEIPFFGNIISANGLRMDPQKIEAITSMDPSTCLADLQTFLGMTQFLTRFIPNLAALSANLWGLTKKSSDFQWCPEHQSAVDSIKQAITSPKSLQYFDNSKPVTIQVDASQRGLGATLLQDNGPVEYRSKLLTDTESRYSNIEREMLAVVHGLEKLHYYAYGRHVIVESDHKPLEAIFKKNLSSAPPRIARMMLRIQKYDMEIKYVPGKNIPLADALSRISSCPGDTIEGLDVSVHELGLHLNASPARIQEIKDETVKDETLHSLRSFITRGWPDTRSECPEHLHAYWNYRDELTVYDGIILKGTRIVIPKTLQAAVLEQLHCAHQGTEKCKLRAKGSVFWANINRDIDDMVKRCSPCQHNQKAYTQEPLMPHDVPQRPWHTLGADLFFWNNASYLLVSDYYSKFPLVRKLNNLRSETTIAHMKSIFEEFEIPSKIITANDTQFTSAAFKEFSVTYGFTHIQTSPHFPQATGFIERTVQTVKNLLQKCKESNTDPHMAMLCLRSTPIDHNLPSPAELLNSRVYQTNLPAINKPHLRCMTDGDTNAKLQQRQEQQKSQHDKSSKILPNLHPGEHVRVRDPHTHKWEPGVIDSGGQNRSYTVSTGGSRFKRNRRHLRPTGEKFANSEEKSTSDSSTENIPTLEPNPTSNENATPDVQLRRSSRNVRPPDKLNL